MRYGFICCAMVLGSIIAYAQPADSLDEGTKKGFLSAYVPYSDSSEKEVDLEEVIITAQYAPTHIRNALHDVRVIRQEEIRRMGFTHLDELLTNQLNLRVEVDPVLGTGLQIQGIGGENVQILIDGVPVIGRNDGNIDLSQINLNNIAQVEIIQGAMSAQYGSNASGGVINIITDRAAAYKMEVSAQNQHESVGIWNSNLSLKTNLGKISGRFSANRYQIETHPEDSLRLFTTRTNRNGEVFRTKKHPWNPKIQHGLEGLLKYQIRDSLQLRYNYRWFDETVRSLGEKRRLQFRPYAFDQYFHTMRQDHNLQMEGYFGNNWFLHTWLAYNIFERRNEVERINFEEGDISPMPNEADTSRFTNWLHRGVLSYLSGSSWDIQIGWEWMHETGSGERIIDSTSRPYDEATISNYAAWGSMTFRPNSGLSLMASLRYGYNTQYDHPLIPAFNMKWQPRRNISMRFSYARGFRAPSLKELHLSFIDANHFILGNTELEAEHSHNVAWSMDYHTPRDDLAGFNAKVRLFYNHINDRIILAQFEAARFNYQNVDEFRTYGTSLETGFQPLARLTLRTGLTYTWLSNRFNEEEEVPEFSGVFEMQNQLIYQIAPVQTQLRITHRFIGRQVQFFLNEASMPEEGFTGSFHLINATFNRSFWQDRITFTTGVKNILDTQTVEVVGGGGSAHGNAGDSQLLNWGRSYFLQLDVNFHTRN